MKKLKNSKVEKIENDIIYFSNGAELTYLHITDCCENHYLSFENTTIKDFEGLVFDLTNENFFKRIEGFGISLNPLNGYPVRIPGYGSNNGYYSSGLELVLDFKGKRKLFDISGCQNIDWC